MWKLLCAMALLACGGSAQAAIVYSNNFDGENGGATALDYTGLRGLEVALGNVDLLANGFDGIACAGGRGSCLDLDGGESGQLVSGFYTFNAGDTVTLRFSISGNQRDPATTDGSNYGFEFDRPTAGNFTFTSSGGAFLADTFDGPYLGVDISQALSSRPFNDVSFSFVPETGGRFRFIIDGYSFDPADSNDDGIGRILDDVSLEIAAVPEPGSWAMVIGGVGLIGAALRRRRTRVDPPMGA